MGRRLSAVAVVACCLLAPAAAHADLSRGIIVRHAPALSAAERLDLRAAAGVRFARRLPMARVEVVTADTAGTRAGALRRLRSDPSVEWAEPVVDRRANTADPLFDQLWGLQNTGQTGGVAGADISAPAAWAYTKGAGEAVAVVDSGVDLDHSDLRLTGNPGERGEGRESDGIDNDGNGYVDDWQGWSWFGVEHNEVADDWFGHGTHVAGTIAATENGIGVVGVAPEAGIVPLKVLNLNGFGGSDSITWAFAYAGALGIKVVNASLGGNSPSLAEQQAITDHPGTLYVASAGNEGAPNSRVYPCDLPVDNIICVGASDASDQRATFSNFGTPVVDLFAPGTDILSTTFDGDYGAKSGTSMAAPQVAGAAALLFAAVPGITPVEVKAALMGSADHPAGLVGTSVTDGRLNVAAALAAAGAALPPSPPATPAGLVATAGDGEVALEWDDNAEPDLVDYRVYARAGDGTWPTEPLNSSSTSDATITGLTNGVPLTVRVTAVDADDEESPPSADVTATPVVAVVEEPPTTTVPPTTTAPATTTVPATTAEPAATDPLPAPAAVLPAASTPPLVTGTATAVRPTLVPTVRRLALRAGRRRIGDAVITLIAGHSATVRSPAANVGRGRYRVTTCLKKGRTGTWRCRSQTVTLRGAGRLPVVAITTAVPAGAAITARVTVQRRTHGRMRPFATTRATP